MHNPTREFDGAAAPTPRFALKGWRIALCFFGIMSWAGVAGAAESQIRQVRFPVERPADANFNRPDDGEVLDISPPGFCWWRAGERGRIAYVLRIDAADGREIYRSPVLRDPVHVPNFVLPPGDYAWSVAALAGDEAVDTLGPRRFRIAADPHPMPWVEPENLLARVPKEHPRLLFSAAKLPEIRATLDTTRREAFEELKATADRALGLAPMKKPDFSRYDRVTQYPERRMAYRQAYQEFSAVYHRGMLPLALMYVLTGDTKYGEAAKAHFFHLSDWETDGIASLEFSFDEIGLRIARTIAQGYDWLHGLMTPAEREAAKRLLVVHGDQMLARLEARDFLNFSGYSHDGRLPGYLVEFAIALAEEPRARVWMDYAMRTLLTIFPHWAGTDGGWAEGINYSLSYHDRFITPLQSLYAATGYDLWQKPFFREFRHFLMYNISPRGEVMPFGDGEQIPVRERMDEIVSILQFHARQYNDPTVAWWTGRFDRAGISPDRLGAMHRLILPDTIKPEPPPPDIPHDRAFSSVGWAALHSDLGNPDEDLMIMFKSSPFGSVSHGYANQNSFVIMKGGRALAIPGGDRYPQHGSPFHFEYTQRTVAHNTLLINGAGQINRDGNASGRLSGFKSTRHLGYVSGDATPSYGGVLNRFVRHVVLIRPALILIVDDIEAPEPVDVQWLMHAREELDIDQDAQMFISRREDEAMKVHLIAPAPLAMVQSDDWPVEPRKGYPTSTAEEPAKQWHFSASTAGRRKHWRIAAVMAVRERGVFPDCAVIQNGADLASVAARFGSDHVSARIRISETFGDAGALIEVRYEPAAGGEETVIVTMGESVVQ